MRIILLSEKLNLLMIVAKELNLYSSFFVFNIISSVSIYYACTSAEIAQLGERQTEDLKVPGSIPGLGTFSLRQSSRQYCFANLVVYEEKFKSKQCLDI